MKFYESHFEEYILENKKVNMHPKLDKIYNKLPSNINNLKNIIFYGPNGVGKYTQVLKYIKKYSLSDLKYEKKITLNFNKQPFFFKISDIHFEIDMSLLGCNSKLLWHEIYQQIIDIISAKNNKTGIIVCKYFNEIHNELLENFYSYMQKNYAINVDIKFFIITTEISFIPDNILNCCEIVNISRPPKTLYKKILKNKLFKNINISNLTNISNIKNFYSNNETSILQYHKIICDKIIENIININECKFLNFRDFLYDIFIYHLDINECIWYIILNLVEKGFIKNDHFTELMLKTFCFLKYYNNNYRPIYHLESYLLNIVKLIHGF